MKAMRYDTFGGPECDPADEVPTPTAARETS